MKFIKEIKKQSSTSISSAGIPDGSPPKLVDHLSLWKEQSTSDLPGSKQQNIPFAVKQVTQIKHLYTHTNVHTYVIFIGRPSQGFIHPGSAWNTTRMHI